MINDKIILNESLNLCCHSNEKDTTTDAGGSGCAAVSACSFKANRTVHSGSVGEKKKRRRVSKNVFFFLQRGTLTCFCSFEGGVLCMRASTSPRVELQLFASGAAHWWGNATPLLPSHTHAHPLWETASACSLKIGVEKNKKTKKGLDSSRAPCFCCIRIRGPARICCSRLRRHFVDGGGGGVVDRKSVV